MTKFPVFNNRTVVWKTVCMVFALVMVAGIVEAASTGPASTGTGDAQKKDDSLRVRMYEQASEDEKARMRQAEFPDSCYQADKDAQEASNAMIKACQDAKLPGGSVPTCYKAIKKCGNSLTGEGAETEREEVEDSKKTCEEYSRDKIVACPQLYRGSKEQFLKEMKESKEDLTKAQDKVTEGQEKLQKLQKDQNARNLKIREQIEKLEQQKSDLQIALQDTYREIDSKNDEQVQQIQSQITDLTEQSQNLQDEVDKADQEMQAKIAEMDDDCYKSAQEALNKIKTDLASGGLVNVSGGINDGTKMNRNIADNPKKILTECLRGPVRMGRVKILVNVRLKAEEALARKKLQLFDRQTKLNTRLSELGTKLEQNKQAAYQKMVSAIQKLDQEKARLATQMSTQAQEDYTAMITSSTDLQNKMSTANELLNTYNTAKTCSDKIPSTRMTKAKTKDDEDPESLVGTVVGAFTSYKGRVSFAIDLCCEGQYKNGSICDRNKARQGTIDDTPPPPATTPSPSPKPADPKKGAA